MKSGIPRSSVRVKAGVGLVRSAAVSWSASANFGVTNDLKLLPPYGEMPPTFLQQHGTMLWLAALAVILLAAIVGWFLTRPKQAAMLAPEVQARRALEDFLHAAESGAVLSQVSQIVRQYFAAVFALPPGETTTTEFCRITSRQERMGAELSAVVCEFLRRCDERKFSPQAPKEPLGAANRALELVTLGEARRAQLQQSAIVPMNHPSSATT